jgi:hypothetical protein
VENLPSYLEFEPRGFDLPDDHLLTVVHEQQAVKQKWTTEELTNVAIVYTAARFAEAMVCGHRCRGTFQLQYQYGYQYQQPHHTTNNGSSTQHSILQQMHLPLKARSTGSRSSHDDGPDDEFRWSCLEHQLLE